MWDRLIGCAVSAICVATTASLAEPISIETRVPIEFNLPSQPLAKALFAYGARTGLEIFYDADLADDMRSHELTGAFTRRSALHTLLRGTGYVAKQTGPDAISIALAPKMAAADAVQMRRNLQPYFVTLQQRIDEAICQHSGSFGRDEVMLQFWIGPKGHVVEASVVDDDGRSVKDQSQANLVLGLIFAPPPSAMPQPVNMVIFPPAAHLRSCSPVRAQGRAG